MKFDYDTDLSSIVRSRPRGRALPPAQRRALIRVARGVVVRDIGARSPETYHDQTDYTAAMSPLTVRALYTRGLVQDEPTQFTWRHRVVLTPAGQERVEEILADA